jgi:ferredoxin
MLVIDPGECIDCAVCIPECPVEAIFAEEDLPSDQAEYAKLNADLAKRWPVLSSRKPALPEADQWRAVRGKREMLDERAENEMNRNAA